MVSRKKKTTAKAQTKLSNKIKSMTKLLATEKKSILANRKAHWDAYRKLQKQVHGAWEKLKTDIQENADPQILIQDRNQLLLLLGECNYMTLECTRHASRSSKK